MTEAPDFSRLMQGVIPYLAIAQSEKAAAFYENAFGAKMHSPAAKNDMGAVMNIGLEINGGMLMLSDPMPDATTCQAMTLQLVTREGDFWWDRAVKAGCTVTHPFKMEFWGDRYGRLRDPFGFEWALLEPGPGR